MDRSVALWLPVVQVKLHEARVYFMKNVIVICSLLVCSSASAASYAPLTGPNRPSVANSREDTRFVSYTLTLSFDNDGKSETIEIAVDKSAFDSAVVGQPFVAGLPMIIIAKSAKAP